MEARLLDVGDPRVDALLDELVTEAVAPTGVVRRQQTRRNGGFEREHQLFAVEARGALEDIEVDVATADSREGEQDLGVVGEETDPTVQHVADAARHVDGGHLGGRQRLLPVLTGEESQQLAQVEEVATGPVEQRRRDLGRRLPAEDERGEAFDLVGLEHRDGEALHPSMAEQDAERLIEAG